MTVRFSLPSYQGDHLCINPFRRIGLIHKWSMIRVSSSDVFKLMFYLTIVNKTYVTVTLGWHDSLYIGVT